MPANCVNVREWTPCDSIIIVNIMTYQRIMETSNVKRINCIIFLICIIMGCLFQAYNPDGGTFISGNNGVQSDRIISFGHIVLEDAISSVPVRGGEIREETTSVESFGSVRVSRIAFGLALLIRLLSILPAPGKYERTRELSGLTFSLKRIILFLFGQHGLKPSPQQ